MIQSLKDHEMQLNIWTHETKSFHVIHSQSQQSPDQVPLLTMIDTHLHRGRLNTRHLQGPGWRLKCPRPFFCSEIVGDFCLDYMWHGHLLYWKLQDHDPLAALAPGASGIFFVAGRPISPEGEEGLHYPTSICQHTSETTLLARPSSHHLQSNPRFQSLNVS